MIKNILFDLDGTLLPMDQDVFVRAYFKRLAVKLMPYGYEPKALEKAIWTGTGAMVMNDGEVTNEEAFWKCFSGIFGEKVLEDKAIFEDFYKNEFNEAKEVCGCNPKAKEAVETLKNMGYRLVLATNPIFPQVATYNRANWAGIDVNDFEMVTTYENCHYCKPNPKYYGEIVKILSLDPTECLMVGNDVSEDMVAESLGMKVFLHTDCLINKNDDNISKYPNGGFDELIQYVKGLK